MNSNEHSSPFRPQPPRKPWHQLPPRQVKRDDTLKADELHVERKSFIFLLKENPRGRFLRVIEQSGNDSASIVIPSTGLNEFQKLLAEMLKAAEEIPPKSS
jgi:hypothetical protein